MQRIFLIALAAFIFVVVATIGRVYMVDNNGGMATNAGSVKLGGPFSLVDHTGKAVTDEDYRGKYMMIYFGYTYCPDVCPTSLSLMADALELLTPDQLDKVVPIFITVDPERDTPEALSTYVTHFHDKMVGLSGTIEQTKQVARAYRAFYQKVGEDGSDEYLMDHSSTTYVIGPDGKYATHFGHATPGDAMAKRLAEIL
ncbi:MAG: SCO family protein [Magnetovibrio sp.]|nr:SCO family protein [Magnetovibrio sp.]